MAMFKRIFLMMLVNIGIMITISIVLNLLGVRPYLRAYGLDYQSLMIFCLVWGMGASFISLLISKQIAKWTMGVQIIEPSQMGTYGDIVRKVHTLAKGAGLRKMPEVGVYPGQEVNAFATGPSRNNSMVAVSEGLLRSMNNDEVEGVLAHEVAHIANGDMVTMTLIQGVVNAFVMFLARIAAFALGNLMRSNDNEREGGGSYFLQMIMVFVFEMIFGLIGAVIVAWFSRQREFRADSGGAKLAGTNKMVAALERLKRSVDGVSAENPAMASLKISGRREGGLKALFMTHPPLDERIEALRQRA